MNETMFWETFWRLLLPNLLLFVGLMIGIIGTLLVPISDEERKKAAKEIDEKISSIVIEVGRPINGFGLAGLKIIFFYITGMFIIIVIGATLYDILGLSSIQDTTIRIATVAAEYLPIVAFTITIVWLGQETAKAVGFLIKRFMDLTDFVAKLRKNGSINAE